MTYSVKEIFYTLQGEGANTGRAAVFCRFAGCNLWSGREHDRASAICKFCDTDFVGTDGLGGGKFATAEELAQAVNDSWKGLRNVSLPPMIVCTGGEPLLQLDESLVESFHKFGFEVAVETNGTRIPPKGVDWVCVSPKANTELVVREGDELKLVFPQIDSSPEQYENLNFKHFYLQPMDGPDKVLNTRRAVEYCLTSPKWRISLQTHKILGIA
jgi:7-carboxy-7-deazaguanine synthase